MRDPRFWVVVALQLLITVLLAVLVALQYLDFRRPTAEVITSATLRNAPSREARVELIRSLPIVSVYQLQSSIDVNVLNTVPVEVENTPLEVQNY